MRDTDKLVAALVSCTRFKLRVNGKTIRTNNVIHAADVISIHVGKQIWYRVYRGPCNDFVAWIR